MVDNEPKYKLKRSLEEKSTLEEIRARFEGDVKRFTNLDTGQSTTIDAPLTMALITEAAVRSTPHIGRVLDIGCGAGNNTLKLLEQVAPFDSDLIDLSPAMLQAARQRIAAVNTGVIRTYRGDFRTVDLPERSYDVILAAAVLHHLRDDQDWKAAFRMIFDLLAPGGSVWITDLVSQESDAVGSMMWERYDRYLYSIGGEEYRDWVFEYIDREDSPRPVTYQLELLRQVGFAKVELLHKNVCFAAFGALKA